MDIEFNGETITVDIPDNYVVTDAVLIVRAQGMTTAGSEYLTVASTPSTGGLLQHGMIAMAASPDSYSMVDIYDDEDDD